MKIKNIIVNFLQKLSFAIAVIVFVAGIGYILSILFDKNLDDKHFTVISGIFVAFLGAVFSYMFQVSRDDMEREEEKKAIEEEKTDLEKVKLQSCFYKMHTLLRNLGIIYLRILDLNKPEMRGRKIPIAGMQIKFNDYDLQFLVLKIPLLLEGIKQLEVERNDLLQQLDEMNEYNHDLLLYDTNLHGALIGTIAKMYAKIIPLMCAIDKYLQNKYSAETLRKDYVKEYMEKAEKFVTEMDEKNPDLKLKETMGGWTIKI